MGVPASDRQRGTGRTALDITGGGALGRGLIILCQLNLIETFTHEPVAGLLLENLLNYGLSYRERTPGEMRLAAGEDSPLTKRLAGGGVPLTDEPNAPVLVVDASSPGATVEEVQAHLGVGRSAVLVGLTEENLQNWKELLPDDVVLEETKVPHAVGRHDHPLLGASVPLPSGGARWEPGPTSYRARPPSSTL